LKPLQYVFTRSSKAIESTQMTSWDTTRRWQQLTTARTSLNQRVFVTNHWPKKKIRKKIRKNLSQAIMEAFCWKYVFFFLCTPQWDHFKKFIIFNWLKSELTLGGKWLWKIYFTKWKI
jgi:hypothetical protein